MKKLSKCRFSTNILRSEVVLKRQNQYVELNFLKVLPLQIQINHLITEIHQNSLTVSPLGMFEVSPQLLLVVNQTFSVTFELLMYNQFFFLSSS